MHYEEEFSPSGPSHQALMYNSPPPQRRQMRPFSPPVSFSPTFSPKVSSVLNGPIHARALTDKEKDVIKGNITISFSSLFFLSGIFGFIFFPKQFIFHPTPQKKCSIPLVFFFHSDIFGSFSVPNIFHFPSHTPKEIFKFH